MELSSIKRKRFKCLDKTLDNIMWSNRWIKGQDYPEWAEADVYTNTIQGGYLYNGETFVSLKDSKKLNINEYKN